VDLSNTYQVQSDIQEAHKGQVIALASMDNHLYSCAAKSLKIWDLATM
jgi:hypothetical protein